MATAPLIQRLDFSGAVMTDPRARPILRPRPRLNQSLLIFQGLEHPGLVLPRHGACIIQDVFRQLKGRSVFLEAHERAKQLDFIGPGLVFLGELAVSLEMVPHEAPLVRQTVGPADVKIRIFAFQVFRRPAQESCQLEESCLLDKETRPGIAGAGCVLVVEEEGPAQMDFLFFA
ncbi:MAG: hypothetical protein AAB262_09410 [Elusimicrobiota bacterium]